MADGATVKLEGEPLNVAVIGVGALGRHHARILSGIKGVNLVAVADANAQQAKKIADLAPCGWTTDYRELVGRVDAVVIATPTFAHRSVGTEFLSRKIPTLIEKPLASQLEDARVLCEVADTHNTVLQVGHVERFNPAYQTVQQHAGDVKYLKAERFSPFAFRSTDIGVVHDLMIHDIDLTLGLVDADVASVEAFGVSILGSHEDAVQARIKFENGCIADLSVNRVNPSPSRAIQTWSPQACVAADLTSRDVTVFRPSEALLAGNGPLAKARRPGADIDQLKADLFGIDLGVETPEVSGADALTAELAAFVDCARTGTRPIVSGTEATKALAIADRVLQEVAAHQWDGRANGAVGPLAWFNAPATPVRKAA
ncbi:Gfo/Idh/MocA family protein [Stratiformator vulcanicus]|uniref:Dehydrogenase n=1 Tax=Stratiformator vulcanicus TaxID=2527980 RepID=A0A517R6E3_9PLAN|nr:Gfo/Idh/MocA family oxidoreductase [Stratiformator vulcanicus]QDT39448.1 Dehydrogenase [Stratiformator vulcanicus]